MGSWIALTVLIILGLVLILNNESEKIFGLAPAQLAGIVAGLALLIYLGSSLMSEYRGRMSKAVKDIASWAALALVLVAIYSYRTELTDVGNRVAGELMPPGYDIPVAGKQGDSQAVRIRRRNDGHFEARTQIKGKTVSMIVDTGASTVVLSTRDARHIGINTSRLQYSVTVRTANGITKAAPVKLPNLSIGYVKVTDVEALVAAPGALHQSLLGMSFLSRLRSYEFSGDFLTLRG